MLQWWNAKSFLLDIGRVNRPRSKYRPDYNLFSCKKHSILGKLIFHIKVKKKFWGSIIFGIDSILNYYHSDQIDLWFERYFCNVFDILVKTTKIDLCTSFFSVLYLSESKVLEVIKTTCLGFILPTFRAFCWCLVHLNEKVCNCNFELYIVSDL